MAGTPPPPPIVAAVERGSRPPPPPLPPPRLLSHSPHRRPSSTLAYCVSIVSRFSLAAAFLLPALGRASVRNAGPNTGTNIHRLPCIGRRLIEPLRFRGRSSVHAIASRGAALVRGIFPGVRNGAGHPLARARAAPAADNENLPEPRDEGTRDFVSIDRGYCLGFFEVSGYIEKKKERTPTVRTVQRIDIRTLRSFFAGFC